MTPSDCAELGLTVLLWVLIGGRPRNRLTAAAVQVFLTLMIQTWYSHTSALNKCVTVRSGAQIPSKRRLYVSLNNSTTTFPTGVIIAGDERASSLFHLSPLPCLSFPPSLPSFLWNCAAAAAGHALLIPSWKMRITREARSDCGRPRHSRHTCQQGETSGERVTCHYFYIRKIQYLHANNAECTYGNCFVLFFIL